MSISISKRKINKINNFQFIVKYKLSIIKEDKSRIKFNL